MIEKCCGTCQWFSDEDMFGYGFCETKEIGKQCGDCCPMWHQREQEGE